jgi:hypothetical protein
MYLSPQKYGKIFESEIHEFLNKTNCTLLNETQIRKYDNTITAIDHMLFANDICFCFQDKWLKTSISNSDFNHFAKCVEKVSTNIIHIIYAIYISNNNFSSIAEKIFNEENDKFIVGTSKIKYIKINSTEKKTIFKELHYLLHSNNVFIYDYDDDCIML